jgi:hypothetical protein
VRPLPFIIPRLLTGASRENRVRDSNPLAGG